jgi:prevent-host-death family protein
METVGSYEAKTHLSRLLDRVARGERITITKHGAPVALLIPAGVARAGDVLRVIDEIRHSRKGRRLGGLSIRRLIEEGRRH